MRGQHLHILNCNQHTEASDFLGGFRPARGRAAAVTTFVNAVSAAVGSRLVRETGAPVPAAPVSEPGAAEIETMLTAVQGTVAAVSAWVEARVGVLREEAEAAEATAATSKGAQAKKAKKEAAGKVGEAARLERELEELRGHVAAAVAAGAAARVPFQWVDGPLVTAMRRGDMILVDEINLAEDAVLERLNRCEGERVCLEVWRKEAAQVGGCVREACAREAQRMGQGEAWSVGCFAKRIEKEVIGAKAACRPSGFADPPPWQHDPSALATSPLCYHCAAADLLCGLHH